MATNAEIIEWVTAEDLRPALESSIGLRDRVVEDAITSESMSRSTEVLGAVSSRATILRNQLATDIETLRAQVATLDTVVGSARKLIHSNEAPTPEEPITGSFDPFSIIASGIDRYSIRNGERQKVRDLVQRTLFPESNWLPENEQRRARSASSHTINSVLRLLDPRLQQQDRFKDEIQRHHEAGIEIVPGKGVTFADPDAMYIAYLDKTKQDSYRHSRAIVSPNLMRFVELHTK